MCFRIVTRALADKQMENAYSECERFFGESTAISFMKSVYEDIELLATQPYIGRIEPLLEDMRLVYRSLVVHKHYKVVYVVEEEIGKISVVAFWDTRRDPKKLRREIKK